MHVLAIKNNCAAAMTATATASTLQKQQRQRQKLDVDVGDDANEEAAAAASTETEQFNNNYRQCKKYNDDKNKSLLKTRIITTTTTNTIEKTLATNNTSTSTNTNKSSNNNSSNTNTSNWWHRCSRSRQGLKNGSARCANGAASLLLPLSLTMRTTKANNDNCKYSYNFNKINNKLWLITCMLLIMLTVTTTICQIEATLFGAVAAAATLPASSSSLASTTTRTISTATLGSSNNNNYMGAANSPLSALLKSGGATYLKTAAAVAPTTTMQQQRQLQQQQLFAMLTKNAINGGSASNGGVSAAAALNVGATSGRHFLMLHADEDAVDGGDVEVDGAGAGADINNDNVDEDDDNVSGRDFGGYENFASLRVPTDLRNVRRQQRLDNVLAVPPPLQIPVASLETTGFVADDGQQYEKAEKVLAAAAANTQVYANSNNNNNNHCPKECKCLNVYFDCGKLHLDRVPTLPIYVQTLDLAGNKLNDTTVLEIKNLPELHKLTLKRNQLDVLPKFSGLTMLKQLNLAGNRIQGISSDALAALPKLKSLDLSRNYLHAVESNWFPTPNKLAHLTLNHNMISSVAENAFESLDLIELEMNNNRLLNLPGGVFNNQGKLKKLSLNNNHLEINWSTFRGLLSLQKLFLQSNNIRALQDGVFHVMRNIETIELDHNRIMSLSRQGLFNLTKLHTLRLSNNSISRIELDTWEFTQSLEILDLSYNNISEFKPQHLDCLQRLKNLNLGHNKIQYLMDNTFDCVKNLEDLNLRRNRLAWVIEDPNAAPPFKALRKLKKLDLYGNNLKQINSKSLNGLGNLELLNLGGNALATIQAGAFDYMPRLQKLIFKSLNFICDCELLWFRRFLQTRFADNASMPANVVCGYPEHMLDRTLDQLKTSELLCIDSPKPVLKQEPTNLLAVKGANITMECIAQSPAAATLAATDELKIKWRHDNQNVRERSTATSHGAYSASDTQIRHDQSTNQTTIIGYLRLYNVSTESAGRYQCVVSNAFGTTYSQRFKISIGIHPTFLEKPSNLTIDAGETARLVCSATGDPTPEIALQKFGSSDFPAATERRLQVRRDENAFLITNAKPSDSGIYTCTAESAAGEIKMNATLVVNDKPLPAMPVVRKESDIGATTVLDCRYEEMTVDLLQPQREWFKENKPLHISATSHSERYYFTTDKELLIIVNTQLHDAGHFRCEITDNSKTLTVQTDLIVMQKDTNDYFLILVVLMVIALSMLIILLCVCMRLLKRRKHKSSGLSVSQHERSMNGSLGRIMAGASSQHNMLSSSRGSALDQTQLTTLNRTYLRAAQQQQQQTQQQQQHQQPLHHLEQSPQHFVRPRSLADLHMNQEQSSRLVTPTPNYQERMADAEVLALTYLQHNQKEQQQDRLSSKDSGTGSDAAVKRSIEDFSHVALLPGASSPTTTLQRTVDGPPLYKYVPEEDDDDADDDKDDDNELQFAPTRALGVSVYDDMELSDLNRNAATEHERFLQNNNHNYGGGGGDIGVEVGGGRRNILPRKCSSQMNGSSTNYNVSPTSTTAVDI